MEIIDVYVAYSSDNEYGRPSGMIGIFEIQLEAENHAKGMGFWGGAGTVIKRKALLVNKDNKEVYLLDSQYPFSSKMGINLIDEKRQKKLDALAKLSAEEKELLGIKD